ncbi:hypothetical protein Taro_010769 [Colocasia esculenta]|uniref:galactinol--sucrose galactosyltransferase n=1 Tax=Colocasia esculenta TaxID=4460 RepID=A0A843U8E0_COLES|nr:hypothetical protein [Colocasia esculenta]
MTCLFKVLNNGSSSLRPTRQLPQRLGRLCPLVSSSTLGDRSVSVLCLSGRLLDLLLQSGGVRQVAEEKMTVGAGISVTDGDLVVLGTRILSCVPDNVVVSPAEGGGLLTGAFVGVRSDGSGSRRVFSVGKLEGLRFMCVFRFKLWWMTQRMGSLGRDIPFETQFLMVEGNDGSHCGEGGADSRDQSVTYCVFLPILEGDFRAVLQGNENDELQICLESGDPAVDGFQGSHLVFVAAGEDPFDVITNADFLPAPDIKVGPAMHCWLQGSPRLCLGKCFFMLWIVNSMRYLFIKWTFPHWLKSTDRAVERHLKTFSHREKKKMPDMINWFGWCTWDAFYTDVTAEGVRQGLQSFEKGGIPPKFVIIDDGWQSVGMDATGLATKAVNTANFANRLTHIKENYKFQKNGKEGHREEDPALGLAHIVTEAKERHNLKYVYAWHAITGYWGGVRPGVTEMEHYESKMTYPISSPGVQSNEPCDAFNCIATNGLGLVNPEKVFNFFNELHSYLASTGIDGVKVDVQNILETLGAGHGGRVKLARKYQQALEASIAKNFPDNGIISCMSHSTDGLYSAKSTAVIRASDDFLPKDPASHTIHIASVAYNAVFLGELMQPDWDMFHLLFIRAFILWPSTMQQLELWEAVQFMLETTLSKCSDKPGNHDFNLLKKLVLPDGSILRAKLPGRPTRDCLFSDPARDGKSLLKIWNLNDHCGVVGVFNCQGAGWCRFGKKNLIHDEQPGTITAFIRSKDVDYLPRIVDNGWNGDTVVYSHLGGEVVYLPHNVSLPVTLRPREYEVFTVVPVKKLSNGTSFAPVGLIKMFNSGGSIKELKHESARAATVEIKARGCGTFRAYSSTEPKRIMVDNTEVPFTYDEQRAFITLELEVPVEELYLWSITIQF